MASNVRGSSNRKRKWKPHSEGPKPASTPFPSSTISSRAPRGINVGEYAEARALEVHNMVHCLTAADISGKKRLFQSLPKHMRRRAMSHNIKRMPVRLREQARKEMEKVKSDVKGNPHNKSRRQRRKPKNLLEDYNCRKKQNVWLETHIWHAKRMKMVNVWGYRLAEHPTDKSFRALHRAVSNSCILQDMSYYSCIEVSGRIDDIISAMGHITSKQLGLTVASKQYHNQSREGHGVLYKPKEYPNGAIGPISFMWRQKSFNNLQKHTHTEDYMSSGPRKNNIEESPCNDSKHQTCEAGEVSFHKAGKECSMLWIWVHPACYIEAFQAITEACQLAAKTVIKEEKDCTLNHTQDTSESVGKVGKGEEHSSAINGTEEVELVVSSLRSDLVRYRLTGPLSHALLVSMLEVSNGDTSQDKAALVAMSQSCPSTNRSHKGNIDEQPIPSAVCDVALVTSEDVWNSVKGISCPSVLPPGCMIGLIVVDPRLGLPGIKTSIDAVTEHKTSAQNSSTTPSDDVHGDCSSLRMSSVLCNWPPGTAVSSIWDPQIRQQVKNSKISEQELNRMRSKLLVPDTRLDLGDKTSHVPILLVQQPGSTNQHYGSGWDIILPSGWAMAFWISLVYRGARVGGLREARNFSLEREEPHFPRDFPDTEAGMTYNENMRREGEEKYDTYPPAKRPNYHKLGIQTPFCAPWSRLVGEWSHREEFLVNCSESESLSCSVKDEENEKVGVNDKVSTAMSSMADSNSSISKGTCGEDAKELKKSSCTEGNTCLTGSGDGVRDINQEFYLLRSLSKLNQLRKIVEIPQQRKRERAKKSSRGENQLFSWSSLMAILEGDMATLVCVSLRMPSRGYPLPNATVAIPSSADLQEFHKSRGYNGPVEPLHKGNREKLPRDCISGGTLIGSCTREIIGFVTSGQFSFSRGCGMGIAFCTLPGLIRLLSVTSPVGEVVVLVRNTMSQQYRFAYLRVL